MSVDRVSVGLSENESLPASEYQDSSEGFGGISSDVYDGDEAEWARERDDEKVSRGLGNLSKVLSYFYVRITLSAFFFLIQFLSYRPEFNFLYSIIIAADEFNYYKIRRRFAPANGGERKKIDYTSEIQRCRE
jgi:hypothetical protein